ncbi:DUF5107 domain-containing protein [Paenibacillus solisilvae]|uniref:DUF5107 domain-containing protein n=1 Tax=Paenibacillus solisilvae TaxID=2486751 RepID=A0ABW0VWS7_9BACL
MLKTSEWQETMLYHAVQPCGPLPTVCDEEGIYPYESFCETAKRPNLRNFRMIAIENEWLKATVCPDLGGKVHSILDKASGREILFHSGSVRPVRILPRMAFISGGIEVSFPIAHTPVQIESVHALTSQVEDRLYIWCGEREVRYGMHWTVEYSLGHDDRYLTQRTTFVNPTSEAHAWMSWSNAALPARPDSEFHFPAGHVLRHADVLEEIDWEDRDYRLSEFDRMQGFFWKSADCNAFGMFTPSLGSGLYHIADQAETPGIKLWLYGIGEHEKWAHLTAAQKESYVEIQAGPLLEQADNKKLQPGARHVHTEFWLPSTEPLNIRELGLPNPQLVDIELIPMFDWVPRSNSASWIQLVDAFQRGTLDRVPIPPDAEDCCWPPSGIELLGEALQWAAEQHGDKNKPLWSYYLGVWLAGKGRFDESIPILQTAGLDGSYALLGRLLRVIKQDFEASREAFNRISSTAWSLHPQVFIERDITLAHYGSAAYDEREQWFERVESLQEDGLVERKASFLFDKGAIHEAKTILDHHHFENVHQRYERSRLWNQITESLDCAEAPIPGHLGEDDLAAYGAYRVLAKKS